MIFFTGLFSVLKATLVVPASFAITTITTGIFKGLRTAYYRTKETISNFILARDGQDVSFGHYTKKDLANYKSWIVDHEQDILEILSAVELPEYLMLKKEDILYPTYSDFVKSDTDYLQRCLDKDYRNDIALIESYIADYVKASDEPYKGSFTSRRWWAKLFHSSTKMSPQKMVIKLIGDFSEKTLINFSDKEHELGKLKRLRIYLTKIRQDTNILNDNNFSIFLNKTINQLEEIEAKIQTKLNIDSFKIKLNKTYNSTQSILQDLLKIICNLFNFKDREFGLEADISNYLRKAQVHKVNVWLKDIGSILMKDLNEEEYAPEQYIKLIEPIIQKEINDSDKSEFYNKQHPSLEIADYELFSKLQRDIIEIINILFLVKYYRKSNTNELSLSYKVSLAEIKHITLSLASKLEALTRHIQEVELLKQKLHSYMLDNQHEDYRRTAEICDSIETFKNSVQRTLEYANDAHSALRINEMYVINEQSPVSRLISMLGNQELLFNMSLSVLDDKILKFINSLKEGLKFSPVIRDVLAKYFSIETDINNNELAIKIAFEHYGDSENESSVQMHYLMMLQVFSELLTKYDNYDDCSKLIDKFTEFFINQFMRGSDANMSMIVKFFSKELIKRSKDARENLGLKEIIKQHLSSFEDYIIHFLNDACTELDIVFDSQEQTSEKLQKFVIELVKKINFQSEENSRLINQYNDIVTSEDQNNQCKSLMDMLTKQLSETTKTSKITLKSLELISNLIQSAVILKESYRSLIGISPEDTSPSIFDISKPELDNMGEVIRAAIKVQHVSKNKLNIKVNNIKKIKNRSIDSIIQDIDSKVKTFKTDILASSNYALYIANVSRYFGGTSISIEFALISFIQKIASSDDAQEVKLFKIVSLLKYALDKNKAANDKIIFSGEFLGFSKRILSLIDKYYTYNGDNRISNKLDSLISNASTAHLLLPYATKNKIIAMNDSLVKEIDNVEFMPRLTSSKG